MCLVGYGPYAYMCEKYLNLSNSSLILRNPSKPDNLLEEPKGTFYDSEAALCNCVYLTQFLTEFGQILDYKSYDKY